MIVTKPRLVLQTTDACPCFLLDASLLELTDQLMHFPRLDALFGIKGDSHYTLVLLAPKLYVSAYAKTNTSVRQEM